MNTFLITSHLRSSFRAIGACVHAVPLSAQRFGSGGGRRIDVSGDTFQLMLPVDTRAVVLDCRKPDRHLVLSLQDAGAAPQRFLCGFDERHWFAAAVTGQTVSTAKESLMPVVVREAVRRAGLRHDERYRRHTKAFIRQGEWFFVPDHSVEVDPLTIHRSEPLIRPGGGMAHVVDELARGRGEMVWHHPRHAANGVTEAQFRRLSDWTRSEKGWSRRTRITGAVSVYARGAVRHPDHATIHLLGWHRVHINGEQRPASLGFLD